MGIEERISELEIRNNELQSRVNYLESRGNDRFVSAKELAAMMGCSRNNVYLKIRNGNIFATKKLGDIPRIPLSQFYEEDMESKPKRRKVIKKEKKEKSLKDIVFEDSPDLLQ